MAEEFVAATVVALLEKAIVVTADRLGLMPGFKGELKAMKGHAKEIQALLADAERKQSNNTEVLRWLTNVEGAALEAEYVLDELHYESLRREVHQFKRGTGAEVCSFFSMSKHDISFRVRMSSRVRAINAKLKDIILKATDIELVRLGHALLLSRDDHVTVEAANRQTDSLPEQFVAGRKREKTEIVEMLLLVSSDDNNPRVSVLPIVGMGGLGKTTLAKSIYNNEEIVNHFSKRCWVCVSDKFGVTDILKAILQSLKEGERVEMISRDDIVRGIQNELSGKRFLFVLDDVWNEDSGLWDSFFTSLVGINSANGSCCVVTTRLQTVANLVSTSSFEPFPLGKLLDNDCWFIIGTKATKGGEMPAEFEIYKEEILKKCQGLPLAANVIGGLLSLQTKEEWFSIVEKEILKVGEIVEDKIVAILKLSYDLLPYPRVKKCFVYCSVYGKDTKMEGQKLIELWMAEGYLQDDMQGRTTMEEDGAGCLKLLLQSSLLEKEDCFYRMHDLVHDLAESISKRKQHDGDRSRHVKLVGAAHYRDWNEDSSLIQVVRGPVSGEMLQKYRHARVIDLHSSRKLNMICKLKHLRCLTLFNLGEESLPESLCKLYNLQTLTIEDSLRCLPQGLSNLISLRHLHFEGDENMKMAPNMGRLTCLQTLKFFNVGEEKTGREIKELGFMENVTGKLTIRNLELVKSKNEAESAKLNAKKNLKELDFRWGWTRSCDNTEAEHVLEGLEPCPGLQRLVIRNYMGARSPRWLGNLSLLEHLELYFGENITELGYSGDSGFPNLKNLRIFGCPQLSSVRTSFPILRSLWVENTKVSVVRDIVSKSGANSLLKLFLKGVSGMHSISDVTESSVLSSPETLEIVDCDDLIEIPNSALECFTCLESLQVRGCRELVSFLPNLQQTLSPSSLVELWLIDCPKLEHLHTDAIRSLTNLRYLTITMCPLLRQTQRDEIKAIPNLRVFIDY